MSSYRQVAGPCRTFAQRPSARVRRARSESRELKCVKRVSRRGMPLNSNEHNDNNDATTATTTTTTTNNNNTEANDNDNTSIITATTNNNNQTNNE